MCKFKNSNCLVVEYIGDGCSRTTFTAKVIMPLPDWRTVQMLEKNVGQHRPAGETHSDYSREMFDLTVG